MMATKKKSVKRIKQTKRPYVIVRCRDAGVHAGEYLSHTGRTVRLANARRLWYWSGARELNEIAAYGAKNPAQCKFAPPVTALTLLEACEIIACASAGEDMIRECPEWRS